MGGLAKQMSFIGDSRWKRLGATQHNRFSVGSFERVYIHYIFFIYRTFDKRLVENYIISMHICFVYIEPTTQIYLFMGVIFDS